MAQWTTMYNSQDTEASQMFTDRGIKNMVYIYTQWEYYSAIEKNEMMPCAATWMDPMMMIRSQTENKCHMIITQMWTLKMDTRELIYKIATDSQS